MFAKPYKLKSSHALKNSEKKHLAQRVQDEFSFATEEKVKIILPLKGSCSCMKLVLHSGDLVNVYALDGAPMLIETPEGLFPTVCALWKVPDLVPTLTIHSPVLAKIQNGAPLYLPGVALPTQGIGFPMFSCGTILAACTEDNAAACVVGRAAMSSADMLLRASGVCLDTLHVYGDSLCKDQKFSKVERPKLGSATSSLVNLAGNFQQISLQASREEWPSLVPASFPSPSPTLAPNEPRVIPVASPQPAGTIEADDTIPTDSSQVDDIPTDMDELLKWCLLSFIKLEGKRVDLPLKTNILYKKHLHALCPAERALDVRKSSYKKVGKFLEAMQQEGLVESREVEKGVSAVVAVNVAHPLVRRHVVPDVVRAQIAKPVEEKEYIPPQIREMYCITAHVQDLFAPLKKGTALTAADVRSTLTQFVKDRALSSPEERGSVVLDASLAKVVDRPAGEAVKWDALMSAVTGRMTPGTELRFAGGELRLCRARLEPVTMTVAVRSGNKKVTLVSNLESFGFSLPALAHVCQRGTAASCGVTRSPGARGDQLLLQGDQTHYVAKLLIEKYELPKKFVEGADKALNKKK